TAVNVAATLAWASGGNYEILSVSAGPAVTGVTGHVPRRTVRLSPTGAAGEGGTITYTASVGAPVTGSDVTVSLSSGQTITIPVGSSSGTVNVPVGDDLYAGTAVNVAATIASASGGNYESLSVSAVPAVTVVTDDVDVTTV